MSFSTKILCDMLPIEQGLWKFMDNSVALHYTSYWNRHANYGRNHSVLQNIIVEVKQEIKRHGE